MTPTARFPLLCLTYLLLCLGLQTHGFSLGSWGSALEAPEVSQTLIGKNRTGRSDDWMGQLPLILSQTQHEPPFPVVNTLIHPNGQNMVFGVTAPVLHWSTIFKPHMWGYFLSPDFGLSWHWNIRIVALALSSYFFFLLLFKATPLASALGALCLINSSFFAYWSFISEPLTSLALASLCLAQLIVAKKHIVLCSAALAWTATSFCLSTLYPPFQIPLLYFVLFVGVSQFSHKGWPRSSILWTTLSLLLCTLLVGIHFWLNQEIIGLFTNTDYPGQRVSTGGSLSFSHFFHLTLLAVNGYSAYSPINISELGSGFFIGYVFFFASFFYSPGPNLKSLRVALQAITVLFSIYCFIGIPDFLAKLTLLSFVPAHRVLGLWTLLNISWLVFFVCSNGRKPSPLIPLSIFTTVLLSAGMVGNQASQQIDPTKAIIGTVIALATALSFWRVPRLSLGFVFIVSLVSTAWFNPISFKTHSKILASDSVLRLKKDLQEGQFQHLLFLDQSAVTANLPRMIGIPSFGGLHYPPQLRFFEKLQPSGESRRSYNRFAYTSFKISDTLRFSNPSPDTLIVGITNAQLQKHFPNTKAIENFQQYLRSTD